MPFKVNIHSKVDVYRVQALLEQDRPSPTTLSKTLENLSGTAGVDASMSEALQNASIRAAALEEELHRLQSRLNQSVAVDEGWSEEDEEYEESEEEEDSIYGDPVQYFNDHADNTAFEWLRILPTNVLRLLVMMERGAHGSSPDEYYEDDSDACYEAVVWISEQIELFFTVYLADVPRTAVERKMMVLGLGLPEEHRRVVSNLTSYVGAVDRYKRPASIYIICSNFSFDEKYFVRDRERVIEQEEYNLHRYLLDVRYGGFSRPEEEVSTHYLWNKMMFTDDDGETVHVYVEPCDEAHKALFRFVKAEELAIDDSDEITIRRGLFFHATKTSYSNEEEKGARKATDDEAAREKKETARKNEEAVQKEVREMSLQEKKDLVDKVERWFRDGEKETSKNKPSVDTMKRYLFIKKRPLPVLENQKIVREPFEKACRQVIKQSRQSAAVAEADVGETDPETQEVALAQQPYYDGFWTRAGTRSGAQEKIWEESKNRHPQNDDESDDEGPRYRCRCCGNGPFAVAAHVWHLFAGPAGLEDRGTMFLVGTCGNCNLHTNTPKIGLFHLFDGGCDEANTVLSCLYTSPAVDFSNDLRIALKASYKKALEEKQKQTVAKR